MSLTAEQARELADQFLALAKAAKEYRLGHFNELTMEERTKLTNSEAELRDYCSDLTTKAVGLTLDEAQAGLQRLQAVTDKAKQAVETVNTVKKVINIAAAAVKLGAAIASQNPAAITAAADNLYTEAAG